MKDKKVEFKIPLNKKECDFVGFDKSVNGSVFAFPCQYLNKSSYKEDEWNKLCKREAKKIINLIVSTKAEIYDTGNDNQETLQFYSMLWIIQDYIECGIYKEREFFTSVSDNGKINWKKTIKDNKIWFNNNNIIYYQFQRDKYKYEENSTITEIYKLCLSFAVEELGWLFDINKTEKSYFNINTDLNFMINFLNKKLANTFVDYKRMLFSNMLNILNGYQKNAGKNQFILSDNEFEYVWEKLVNICFSSENVKNFYNEYEYHINGQVLNASKLRPDTILINNNKCYILDAKYYNFGYTNNLKNSKDLPQSSSITKQLAYKEYFLSHNNLEIKEDDDVFPVFLLPFAKEKEGEEIRYIGFCCESTSNKTRSDEKEKVYVFKVDLKTLVDCYNNEIVKSELKNKLIEIINKGMQVLQ